MHARPTPWSDETRLLARCAREIALEAGPGTHVVPLDGSASRGAALLEAAIEALPPAPSAMRRRRELVFVAGERTAAMSDGQLATALRRVGAGSRGDALLVVGEATPRRDSLARFARLAAAAAWEHCQLWSDAGAAFAVHVLVRAAALDKENAHVTET